MYDFYIVATPIGNYNDITLRALEILKNADFIVCEEENQYKKLFSFLKIKEKKFILCSEHNEDEAVELTLDLLKKSEKGALISDCGTPLFEDPGFKLISEIRKNKFTVSSVPGANSLITALSLSPFKIKDFYYAGFLPKKQEERQKALKKILKKLETIVLIESPYRLINIVSLLNKYFYDRNIFIACDLTLPTEFLIWGKPAQILQKLKQKKIKKAEFIVIIEHQKVKK
jgi:16S rRNA (cytidine1402-2'-O)-methyltransferase